MQSKCSQCSQWCRCNTHYTGYLSLRISWRCLEINLHNPPWSFFSPSLSFSSLIFFFFYLVNMAERVHPERASWVFKKRAWSEGLGGCGPFPAVFSQQNVGTMVCLCACNMKAPGVWESNLLHTAICIFYITLIKKRPINKQSILSMYN